MSQVPALQDPLTQAAKRLGEAKTQAAIQGLKLLDLFAEIQKEVLTLSQHGLSVTTVSFENKAIHAAWREHTTGDWSEVPMMETEDTLIARVRKQ